MTTFVSSDPGSNLALAFTFGISLTVCLARICYSLSIGGIGFKHLTDSGINLSVHSLILILFLEVTDLDDKGFFLASDD